MSRNMYKFSKQDKIGITVLSILIISLSIISPFLPDERPEAIKRELKKQGYDVENVDFHFVRDGDRYREWIFQSSVPLDFDGYYVSQWAVTKYGSGFIWPSTHFFYHVKPYPPLQESMSVSIIFTAEEFERIAQYAASQPVEEYLKQVIVGSIGKEQ